MITASEVLSHPLQMLGKEGRDPAAGGGWDGFWDSYPPPFPAASETMIITSEQTAGSRAAASMKMTNCGADPLDE